MTTGVNKKQIWEYPQCESESQCTLLSALRPSLPAALCVCVSGVERMSPSLRGRFEGADRSDSK